MKKILLTTIITALYITTFGQTGVPKIPNDIVAKNQVAMYKDEKKPSISIYIADEPKKTLKAWKKYLSTKYELKTKNIKGWQTCEGCNILDISEKHLSFYYKVDADGEGSRMTVIVKNVLDVYVDAEKTPEMDAKTKKILEKFTRELYLKTVNSSLAVFQKGSQAMATEKLKLEKKRTSFEKVINSSKTDIVGLQQKVDGNQQKIAELNAKIALLNAEVKETQEKIETNTKLKSEVQTNLDKKNADIKNQNESLKKIQEMKDRLTSNPIQ